MDAMPIMMMMGMMFLCVCVVSGGFAAVTMLGGTGTPYVDPALYGSTAPGDDGWGGTMTGSDSVDTSSGTSSTSDRYGHGWEGTATETVECPLFMKTINGQVGQYQNYPVNTLNSLKVTCDDGNWKLLNGKATGAWPLTTGCDKGMTGVNIAVFRPGKEGEILGMQGICYNDTKKTTKKNKKNKAGAAAPTPTTTATTATTWVGGTPKNFSSTYSSLLQQTTFNCPKNQRIKKIITNSGERINGVQFICG